MTFSSNNEVSSVFVVFSSGEVEKGVNEEGVGEMVDDGEVESVGETVETEVMVEKVSLVETEEESVVNQSKDEGHEVETGEDE